MMNFDPGWTQTGGNLFLAGAIWSMLRNHETRIKRLERKRREKRER